MTRFDRGRSPNRGPAEMSGCGACSSGAVAARLISSSLASAQRGNEVVPHMSHRVIRVQTMGTPPRESLRPTLLRGCVGMRSVLLGIPRFTCGMGLCQHLRQLFIEFEANHPPCFPARALRPPDVGTGVWPLRRNPERGTKCSFI